MVESEVIVLGVSGKPACEIPAEPAETDLRDSLGYRDTGLTASPAQHFVVYVVRIFLHTDPTGVLRHFTAHSTQV